MDTGFARNLLTNFKRRSLRDTASYILGRFHGVRRAYGVGKGLLQQGNASTVPPAGEPVFAPFGIEAAVRSIGDTALFSGLTVPQEIVDELTAYAKTTALRPPTQSYNFMYDDVRDGRVPNGDPAILAIVVGASRHPLVRRIACDPQVLEVVRRYLGYEPRNPEDIRLLWSFVSATPDAARAAAAQTIAYHFDVHDYNFIYANYYLTDCDARSGAHAMILTSHRDKPLSWLLGSVRQERDALLRYYGEKNEVVLEGPAGFGFVQDASCYHKAIAPIERVRLMLQVRYS